MSSVAPCSRHAFITLVSACLCAVLTMMTALGQTTLPGGSTTGAGTTVLPCINDTDSDGVCDLADSCPLDSGNDEDEDGICDAVDSCPQDHDNDPDVDGICSGVDTCATDSENDADSDNLCHNEDACPYDAENDADSDEICQENDVCPYDAANDFDGDAICAAADSCPEDPENDADSDSVCHPDDVCPLSTDADGDYLCSEVDSCPDDAGNDVDGDLLCHGVDSCPLDAENDADGDRVCGNTDLCPYSANNSLDSSGLCAGQSLTTTAAAAAAGVDLEPCKMSIEACRNQALHTCNFAPCTAVADASGLAGAALVVDLSSRNLTGTLPASLGELSNGLVELNVADNALTGSVPPVVGSLRSMRRLLARRNRLSGPLPANLNLATGLTAIDLFGNRLTGTIPPTFFSGSSSATGSSSSGGGGGAQLRSVNLAQNLLRGKVPDTVCALASSGSKVVLNDVSCSSEYAINYENRGFTMFDYDTNTDHSYSLAHKLTPSYIYAYSCKTYYCDKWLKTATHSASLTPALYADVQKATFHHFLADDECGVEFALMNSTEDGAVAAYPSIADNRNNTCSDSRYLTSKGPVNVSNPPHSSIVHYRQMATCNVADGRLQLQEFSCPLPTGCSTWLRDTAGVSSCVVDADDFFGANQSLVSNSTLAAVAAAQLRERADSHTVTVPDIEADFLATQATVSALSANLSSQQLQLQKLLDNITAQRTAYDQQTTLLEEGTAQIADLWKRVEALTNASRALNATSRSCCGKLPSSYRYESARLHKQQLLSAESLAPVGQVLVAKGGEYDTLAIMLNWWVATVAVVALCSCPLARGVLSLPLRCEVRMTSSVGLLVAAAIILTLRVQYAAARCSVDACSRAPIAHCSLDYCTTDVSIDISNRQLSGTLPAVTLATLIQLTALDISGNQLSGSLPPGLGSLSNLRALYLQNNVFTGQIPDTLAGMSNLVSADFSSNSLSASLPSSLGLLASLETLDVSRNYLGGVIPDEFCQLADQGTLVAFNNVTFSSQDAINYQVNGFTLYDDDTNTDHLYSLSASKSTPSDSCDSTSNNCHSALKSASISMTLSSAGVTSVAVDRFSSFMSDVSCGIPVTRIASVDNGNAFEVNISNLTASCNDVVVDGRGTSGAASSVEHPPFGSITHYRTFTDTNFNGSLRLQRFTCPYPSRCSSWLRNMAGAGVCEVEYESVAYVTDTLGTQVSALSRTVSEQKVVLDLLDANASALVSEVGLLESTTASLKARLDSTYESVEALKQIADLQETVLRARADALQAQTDEISGLLHRISQLESQLSEQSASTAACCSWNEGLLLLS